MLFTAKERKGKPFLGIVLLHQNLKLLRPLYCRKIWVSSGSGVIVKTSFEGILQASYRLSEIFCFVWTYGENCIYHNSDGCGGKRNGSADMYMR